MDSIIPTRRTRNTQKQEKNPHAFMGDSNYRKEFFQKESKEQLRKNKDTNSEINRFFKDSNAGDHIGRTVGHKDTNFYMYRKDEKMPRIEPTGQKSKYVETDVRRKKVTNFQQNPYKIGANVSKDSPFAKQQAPVMAREEKRVRDVNAEKNMKELAKNKASFNLIKMQQNKSHNLKNVGGNLNGQRVSQSGRNIQTFQHNRLW